MLYVFLVDTGNMIQLDMNTALESVSHLKTVVARTCSIPPDKQVLLISGGENLSDDERVCKYAAGTDTNPIFLFSLVSIENQSTPEIETGYGDDAELFERIDSSKTLRDNHNTVAVRTSVAQEVLSESTKQARTCENLIHDQHLQHQGWAAAVANLDDIILDLQRIFDRFLTTFNNYLGQREKNQELINSYDDDVAILHKIPVFPALLESETTSMVGSVIPSTPYNGEPINLLQWINSRGSNQSLDQLADSCYRSLQKLDSDLLEELTNRVSSAVCAAQNTQMKEIRGLGDRLSALEQYLIFVKGVLQEQMDLAKAFAQNQQRASGLNDASILPDLCASHRRQLDVMKENHHQIINVRTKCLKAKSELSINLQARMKWVVFVQNQIAEVQQYLVLHYEELKRLQKRMEVLEQIHMAPSMYLATAVEVVRRKAFSRSYLQKSNTLADQFSIVFKEENALRMSFNAKLRKHFLSKIFSGMNDLPSEFATQRPEVFDDQLPNVTLADVDMLRKAFPDLAKSLSIPDENALEKLLSKSLHQTLTAEDGETLYSLQSLPKKIHLRGGDLSVSIINKLMSGENGVSKKRSAVMERFSDSETDTETERISRRRHSRKKSSDKLTRSLPLENCFDSNEVIKSTGFSVEANNEEPSSSSAAPSSSSGANTANCSSVAPSSSSDGSVMKQGSQHWASNGDDKSAIIASLTTKVNDSETKIQRLQDDIRNKIAPTRKSLIEIASQLQGLKETVMTEKKNFDTELETLSELLVHGVQCVEKKSIEDQESKLSELETQMRSKHEAEASELNRKLELEKEKFVMCQKELESLRISLDEKSLKVVELQDQITDERTSNEETQTKLKEQLDADKHMAIRTLTLEHELELDMMRQKLAMSERHQKNDTETQKLKEEMLLKENDLESLRRKMRLLEVADKDRFQAEKDKMVQILEAGFIQREKVSIQTNLEAAEAKHKEDLIKHEKRLQDKYKHHLETSREKLSADWKKKFDDLKSKQNRALEVAKQDQEKATEKALAELRQTLEEEKEAALRALSEKLNAKSRREIEGLRQRFRIMQTTGTFDRSPSLSESEITLESPKSGDMTEIRSAMAAELENALRAERSKFQLQLQQLHEEHQQQIAELSSRDRLQSTAEQQVMFNEALKKAVDEKEAKIVELESKLKLQAKQIQTPVTSNGDNGLIDNGDQENKGKLRGIAEQQVVFNEALSKALGERNVEMERLTKEVDRHKQTIEALNAKLSESTLNGVQNLSNGGDVVGKLAELTRENAKLETELQEAKDLLEKAMTASVMCIPNAPENNQQDIVRFQKENQQLKEQLVKSVNLVKSGRVSINSVERGDNVMVVWNEEHENYIIYTETSNLFHFLHTNSLAPLGLIPSSGPRRLYVTAEVVDKEYCQARRSENRFKVPLGTKFYRIMCKPLVKDTPSTKSPSASLGAAKGCE